jgi:hypothetical protein
MCSRLSLPVLLGESNLSEEDSYRGPTNAALLKSLSKWLFSARPNDHINPASLSTSAPFLKACHCIHKLLLLLLFYFA